jgi:hypothetical protein
VEGFTVLLEYLSVTNRNCSQEGAQAIEISGGQRGKQTVFRARV